MYETNTLAALLLDKFFLQSLGDNQQKFPPFNIGQHKTDENKFILQLAVAGFLPEDIDVTLEKNILTISSQPTQVEPEYSYYISGIAKRKFVRRFTLFNDHLIEITKATIEHGVLSIYIEKIISEKDRPRKIPIELSDAKLLNN
jgi:molecular chaperone IbpA